VSSGRAEAEFDRRRLRLIHSISCIAESGERMHACGGLVEVVSGWRSRLGEAKK
jgi:hypothetical protein